MKRMETALLSDTGLAFDHTTMRRALLVTAANPGAEHDLLVTVRCTLTESLMVVIRYVPDKRVLDVAASEAYWRHADLGAGAPETLAATMLADFNNEVVPRWIQVEVTDITHGHQAAVTDRQPKWDNAALLARMKRL